MTNATGPQLTRRSATIGLALGSAGLAGAASAKAPVVAGTPRGIIDCHFHPMVRPIVEMVTARGARSPADVPYIQMIQRWTAEQAVALMDASGIAVAMQSIVPPYGMPADAGAARAFAAAANEDAAGIAARYPGRFGLLASLSMTDSRSTIAEIGHAFDVLKADGVGILTQYQGLRPGDPHFDEILAELDRRRAAVFIHPVLPSGATPEVHNLAIAHTELPFEVTRTIASLLFNGSLRRFPHIRFLFTHGGAAVPMLVERWEQMARQVPGMARFVPDGVVAELARHHFDVATVAHPVPFASLAKMVPSSRILFGSDSPFLPIAAGVQGLGGLTLDDAARRAIRRGNAEALFPRLATLPAGRAGPGRDAGPVPARQVLAPPDASMRQPVTHRESGPASIATTSARSSG